MSTNFHLISDVHNEFGLMPLAWSAGTDLSDTVLLIAGDFGMPSNADHVALLRELCSRYRVVLFTSGNHEYYGSRLDKVDRQWKELEAELPNFKYLNPGVAVVDDVLVIGCTLWTDLNRNDPLVAYQVSNVLNDYKKITVKAAGDVYHKLRARDVVSLNQKHRSFIEDQLTNRTQQRVVVMTHHAPLAIGINPLYRSDYPMNYGYHNTGLERLFEEHVIDVWVHGHTHHQYEETFGPNNTRLLCHPRGYVGHEPTAVNYTPKEFVL